MPKWRSIPEVYRASIYFSVFKYSRVLEIAYFISLRPRQNIRHFADDVLNCNFLNENVWIPIKILFLKVQLKIFQHFLFGGKPLSEPMMTQFNDAYMPKWVKTFATHRTQDVIKVLHKYDFLYDLFQWNKYSIFHEWRVVISVLFIIRHDMFRAIFLNHTILIKCKSCFQSRRISVINQLLDTHSPRPPIKS